MIPKINLNGRILLFDFDGTLVETETLAQQVIHEYFVEKNFTEQVSFSEFIVGRTWKAATESMHQHAISRGIEIDSPEEMRLDFKERYRKRCQSGVRLVPGLVEVLPEIKRRAKFMGIVTGSDRDEVETILRAHDLSHYFDRIWAVGDYEHSKPDPSPYLTAMNDIGVKRADVLVFEDSVAGMESAFRSGVLWVQVAFEGHAKVLDPRSVQVIQDWRDLQFS